MDKSADKIKVGLWIDKEIYKKFNLKIIEIYGHTRGHIGLSVEEALLLWINEKKRGN